MAKATSAVTAILIHLTMMSMILVSVQWQRDEANEVLMAKPAEHLFYTRVEEKKMCGLTHLLKESYLLVHCIVGHPGLVAIR